MKSALVIPALNEEAAIGTVLDRVPRDLFDTVVVADNGSTDATAREASARGALVAFEPRRGYGSACLRALAALPADIEAVAFMDGDGSDDPREAGRLLRPILEGSADLVLGSRVLGEARAGAMPAHQRFGNWLATSLLGMTLGHRYTDLGPFRAIRTESLQRLRMSDRDFGWTVEMQIAALREGLRIVEVPVSRGARIGGRSKVSGTLQGSLGAACKILGAIFRGLASEARGQPEPSSAARNGQSIIKKSRSLA